MNYFITGVGTNIGKTIVSAGDLENSDTDKVKNLVSNKKSVFHKEAYCLTQPMSPHAAAKMDGIEINLNEIQLPTTNNKLIIEGAGGLMVPLNDNTLIIDLIEKIPAEVILVSQNYLGSINHTLLSIESLQARNINIKGIIFNGEENTDSEEFILSHTKVNCLGRIKQHAVINKEVILSYKNHFQSLL